MVANHTANYRDAIAMSHDLLGSATEDDKGWFWRVSSATGGNKYHVHITKTATTEQLMTPVRDAV